MSRDKRTGIQQFVIDLQNASQKASKIITDETANYVKENHKYHNIIDYDKAHIKSRFEYEAEFLTELGYAKASDVAREIFAEIEKKLNSVYAKWVVDNFYELDGYELDCVQAMFQQDLDFAELKKKYTESEKDNGN